MIPQRPATLIQNAMSNAPHFDIDVAAFWTDPYPDLARMRREAPIAFVPQLGSTIFTRRDDIFTQEKRIDVFSSHQPAGLMNTLMGHNMMRKDGDAHMSERAAMFPAVSPRTTRPALAIPISSTSRAIPPKASPSAPARIIAPVLLLRARWSPTWHCPAFLRGSGACGSTRRSQCGSAAGHFAGCSICR